MNTFCVETTLLTSSVAGFALLVGTASAAPIRYTDRDAFNASIRHNAFESGRYATPSNVPDYRAFRSLGKWTIGTLADGDGEWIQTSANGIGADKAAPATRFISGRAATAAGFMLTATRGDGTPVADSNVVITTGAGETLTVSIPAAATFVGFNATLPFTEFSIQASGRNLECVEFLTIGEAVELVKREASDVPGALVTKVTDDTSYFNNPLPDGTQCLSLEQHLGVAGRDRWFEWIAPASGDFVIDTAGSEFDTTLQVFRMSDVPTAGGIETRSGNSSIPRVLMHVESGDRCFMKVGGLTNSFGGLSSGMGLLNIKAIDWNATDFNSDGTIDFFDYLDFAFPASIGDGC